MLAFPGMLLAPAEKAGMKIPENAEDYDKRQFPHFAVFAAVQLGAPMPSPTAHWENAHVIAGIPDDKIMEVTPHDLATLGFQFGYPIP